MCILAIYEMHRIAYLLKSKTFVQLQRRNSQDILEVVCFLYIKKMHLTFCKQALILSRSETLDHLPV
jgi:hypothetical protein